MTINTTLDFAKQLDRKDSLKEYVNLFHNPVTRESAEKILYFVNHSLGTLLKDTPHHDMYLKNFKQHAVEGHFLDLEKGGWYEYDKLLQSYLKNLFGAKLESEVAIPGGGLSDNLNKLLDSFYIPQLGEAYKFATPITNFYSDEKIAEGRIEYENKTRDRLKVERLPEDALAYIDADRDNLVVTDEDVINFLENNKGSVETLLLDHVNFITGYRYDIKKITEVAHKYGAKVIVDAAHALAHIPLAYHEEEVDAAVACTYKQLGAGPGADAVMFIHEKHNNLGGLPRKYGWFSYDEKIRFKHGVTKLQDGARGVAQSNFDIASSSMVLDALKIVDTAGIDNMIKKSTQMTSYFYDLMSDVDSSLVAYITPREEGKEVNLITMKFTEGTERVKKVKEVFKKNNVEIDWRDPDILRLSFHPLRNTYEEIHSFANIIKQALNK